MTSTNAQKTVIITGASDGIGAAAARRLAGDGHRVVVVGRSREKTERVAAETGADHYVADFSRLEEVRGLAKDLLASYDRIDVLANNAGGMFGDRTRTADGFETTLQVNHLAPFLLTTLLMDRLVESHASVIQTSSVGARLIGGRIELDDLNHDRDFRPEIAYGTSKLANILFTTELHRRYHAAGLSAAAFHPGVVASAFAADSQSFMKRVYTSRIGRAFMVTPEKGASQLVWLAATEPGTEWQSGTYYESKRPARRLHPQAHDAELARQLWDRSAELTSGD
ncbi:SDR family NAD(P)-dependent oxidoreductase [Antribacter gilvus]|uniref:SDR family NAD(P)-dependent oxidoreductase n=1 Tax=Antribacter gilvus TaxID=2304675 RepID=UPI000F76FC0B|nr:SDR family NAD(P)-dependent oxidoreductase [Antribacter gilvus]